MIYLVTAVHVIVCVFLIVVVLLQHGQSADIAAAFGGMGSQTAFGARGAATALTKATTWAAVIFMVTSITLSIYAARRPGSSSVMQGISTQQKNTGKPAPQNTNLPTPNPTTPTPPQK